MTAEMRVALKQAVDAVVREREIVPGQRRCVGCGTDYDCYTDECKTCWNRRRNHERRGDNKRCCSGCGCPLENRTPRCQTCRERHKKRKFGRNWEYDRLYSARRRARLRAA